MGEPKSSPRQCATNIAPEQLETRAKALAKELLATGQAPAGIAGLLGAKASAEISPTSCEKAAPNRHFRAAIEYSMYYSV